MSLSTPSMHLGDYVMRSLPMTRVLLAILCSTSFLSAATVVKDSQPRVGVRLKTIRLSPGEPFTLKFIERLAKAELSKTKGARLVQIRFENWRGTQPLPFFTDSTFEHWRKLYESGRKAGGFEIAELIAIDGNAVIRIQDRTGYVEKKVIAGSDPLVVRIRNNVYEVLYLEAGVLYVRSQRPFSEEEGTELIARLNRRLANAIPVELYIRNDEWFIPITYSGYPVANPFIPNGPAPEKYPEAGRLYCRFTACWREER
jgi:hypothetical protein